MAFAAIMLIVSQFPVYVRTDKGVSCCENMEATIRYGSGAFFILSIDLKITNTSTCHRKPVIFHYHFSTPRRIDEGEVFSYAKLFYQTFIPNPAMNFLD
jgi:hypothetical protein